MELEGGTKANVKGCMRRNRNLVDTSNFAEGVQDLYIRVDAIDLAEYQKSRGCLAKRGCSLFWLCPMPVVLILFFIFFGCWYSKRKRKMFSKIPFSLISCESCLCTFHC